MTAARYRKKRGTRLEVLIAPELHEVMMMAVEASHKTITDFVQDAIATKLRNWQTPVEYINSQRSKTGKALASVFDPSKCHESGWPLGYVTNPKAELNYAMHDGGVEVIRERMQLAWRQTGLGEYSEAHLQETLAWHAAQLKVKPKAGAV
jgi:hypothetical protein